MNPRISVISPVYNGEAFVRETIESILDQSFKDWEMLIMDGASKDHTVEIAKEYASKHPQIKIFSEKDEGIGDAFDKGLDKATGDFVCFLCISDGYANKDWFAECVKAFDAHPEVSVVWGVPFSRPEEGHPSEPHFAYAHFLQEKKNGSRAAALWKLAKRAKELGPRLALKKLNAFSMAAVGGMIKNAPMPVKEEWFKYWLRTGLTFPDNGTMTRRDVILDCIPRYIKGSFVVDNFLPLFFNLNAKGYLAYGLPIPANYWRAHEGAGVKLRGKIVQDKKDYLKQVENFRRELIAKGGKFPLIDHSKKQVSEVEISD